MVKQATATGSPSDGYIQAAFDWFSQWLWLFDLVGTAKMSRLLEVFTYAYRRYGVTVFVVDSLSKCGIAEDDYIGQKALVETLCDFATANNVHVHLVSHARKQADESKPTGKMDVKGTGAITDMAFNNLVVWRNKPKEDALKDTGTVNDEAPDAVLICDKQRNHDWEGKIKLWYCKDNQQFVDHPDAPPLRFVDYSEARQ
jgi:twinkle protein